MHCVTNCIIEFDGPDSALVESYYLTHQRLLPAAGDVRRNYLCRETLTDADAVQGQAIGRLVDRVERRNGEWRIARRSVVYEIYRGDPTIPGGRLKPHWTVSRRDGHDPIELTRAEFGLGAR